MVPKIKECIPYIEHCGYRFLYYNRPWYVFQHEGLGREITFTLSEIREAYRYGW